MNICGDVLRCNASYKDRVAVIGDLLELGDCVTPGGSYRPRIYNRQGAALERLESG
jgi:hypothetical protein